MPPSGAPRLCPDFLFNASHAFLAGPFHASLEVVTQKVEPSGPACIDQSRFLRMER